MTDARAPAQALLVDADEPLAELIAEWLEAKGFSVVVEGGTGLPSEAHGYQFILADVDFPRGAGTALLRRLEREHPGTPILALSSAFFAGVEPAGPVARSLGVAAVLPKPLTREALVAAISKLPSSA